MQDNSMISRFLFRLDGSKENDDFFTRRREREKAVAYSGTPMKVGPGWIPDLVEVSLDQTNAVCRLTLIELEATDILARASCRKYLPEPSSAVVQGFVNYLGAVIFHCRVTADQRVGAFQELRDLLDGQVSIAVCTAGALRSSVDFLEEYSLIDQPGRLTVPSVQPVASSPEFVFRGNVSLSREETDGLRRTVRILYAVVMGHDHSSGTLKSWRNLRRKPLDMAVSKARQQFVELYKLLSSKTGSGMRIDCDRLAEEIAALWSESPHFRFTSAQVAEVVRDFVPVSMRFAEHESMRTVFKAARSILETGAI